MPEFKKPNGTPNPCRGCRVKEGELHDPGCEYERCPTCGGQLDSCPCCDSYGREVERRPYIEWPNVCVYCGELWPGMFSVSDEEWKKYIDPRQRDKMVCIRCWDYIKAISLAANLSAGRYVNVKPE